MAWTPENLRHLRLELGWSQAEMGRRMGMDAHRWNAIERGELGLDQESIYQLDALFGQLRDYSRRLRFSSQSESYLKQRQYNQISEFDIESFDD
tara:strand:- start:4632 stop:4913 length:282 start_codon:yes stop_codon:yes gene_type:complete